MPTAPLQYVATLGIDIGKNSFHLIGLDVIQMAGLCEPPAETPAIATAPELPSSVPYTGQSVDVP
jgi:hypothetical protein